MESKEIQSQYPIPNLLNIGIIILQISGFCFCLWWLSQVEGILELALLTTAFGILMNSIYSIIHEAEHGILLSHKKWNDGLGALMTLLFPAPYHLIRQGHLGHHIRNRSDDEAFDLIVPGENPIVKRLQFFGIITGFYWLIVALSNVVVLFLPFLMNRKFFKFERATGALMDSLNSKYSRIIKIEALFAIGLHTSIILLLDLSLLNYFIMYFGFGFMWSAMQYVHHFGTERHVLSGSRNLWIWKPLDLIWLNHNWHRNHHHQPCIPWLYLPLLVKTEEDRPSFLLWAYLRMWRGPRATDEQVENKYAGKIIA